MRVRSVKPHQCRLPEIAEVNPSLPNQPPASTPVAFVPMSSVSCDGTVQEDVEERLYTDVAKGYTTFIDGDVLVAKITPCFENGKIAQVHLRHAIGVGSTEFHIVRPRRGKSNARYLFHFLRLPQVRRVGASRMTGSAGQRRVPEHFLRELMLPCPPLPEQRRIAAILDQADALRTKRREAFALLEDVGASIFTDTFGAAGLGGWKGESRTIGDVMDTVFRYPTYYNIQYVDDGVPEIRGELLNDDGTIVTERARLRFISEQTSARFSRTELDAGDLVMTVRGTIGKLAIVPPALAKSNMTANLIRLSPNRRLLNPVFFWYYTQTRRFKSMLASACSSTTILTIKAPDLKRLPIPLPPLAVQQEFARRVAAVEKLRASHRAHLAHLDELFASLQHRAFRGEL